MAGVLSFAAPAGAHTRSYSYSAWRCEGARATARIRLRHINLAEVIVGAGLESGAIGPWEMVQMRRHAGARIREGIRVTQAGLPCPLEIDAMRGPRTVGEQFVAETSYACPAPIERAGIEIHADLLPSLGIAHTHLLRFALGEHQHEAALSPLAPDFALAPGGEARSSSAGAPSILSFVWTGVTHIAIGYDHIAFLFTLFLVVWHSSKSRRDLVTELFMTATGFTIGHSVTLALSVLGLMRPTGATVELLIAVSIIVLALESLAATDLRSTLIRASSIAFIVALPIATAAGVIHHSTVVLAGLAIFSVAYLEYVRRGYRAGRVRRAVSAIFGLVHGFGFAGVLLDTELSGAALAIALAGFNVGVELGQAAILATLAMLLWRLHGSRAQPVLIRLGSIATFWAACYWLGLRAQP